MPRSLERSGAGGLAQPLEFVGMNWMAVLFLAFCGLLVVEVATGFGFLLRRLAPRLRGWEARANPDGRAEPTMSHGRAP